MSNEGRSKKGFERKVYFYRIANFDEFRDLLPGTFEKIENLPFQEGGRYQTETGGTARLLGYPDNFSYPLKLRFGRTRVDDLPDIEDAGKLGGLEINEDAGLIDVFHLVIFETGIVAAEFNFHGPRISLLGKYLFDKGESLPSSLSFQHLFERDVIEVIRKLDSVNLLEFKVPVSAAKFLKEIDRNMYSAINSSRQAGAEDSVMLSLRAGKNKGKLKRLAQKFAEFISENPQERERFSRLQADGYIDGLKLIKPINLLEDKLITSRTFVKNGPKTRSVNTNLAYMNLIQAFEEKKDDIGRAAMLA